MREHKIILPPEDIYPVDPWRIVQTEFLDQFMPHNETVFSVSNGYLGLRGNVDEGKPTFQRGTFINGFFESFPINYGEKAFGFAETGQSMVNVPDAKIIKLYVDDEPFYLPVAHLLKYERALNMKDALLERELLWETPTGKQILIHSVRLVSMEYRHLAVIKYNLTVLNASANIILSSKLIHFEDEQFEHSAIHDPRKAGRFESPVFDIELERHRGNRMIYGYRTKQSGMTMGCGVDHIIQTENVFNQHVTKAEHEGKIIYNVYAKANAPIEITKFITYHTSRSADPRDLSDRCERTLSNAIDMGYQKIVDDQRIYMSNFWDISDIEIKTSDARVQQMMRFNLFHVWQAAARAEGTGVGARGLTGSAYDGHYFWDTEIFVLPFLIYTEPRIARNLLKFRHSILNKARTRARQVNQKGALFPWRTINGEESSAYFAAGTAQYHINADIMYALRKYVDATGDTAFMENYGVEMLIETARLWYDLGAFPLNGKGEFHIHGVTGPDEYTAIVNNNLYTNMMARRNLQDAVAAVQQLQSKDPQKFIKLLRETGLEPQEIEEWKKAADGMYIPYDKEAEIHPQDDNFLKRDVWDLENTPESKYPLLLNYHPLVLYRHQVIKQADVVMAMFLLNEEFTPYEKKRNFDYYDPLTTGDSSLSACAQGIMAAELGYTELAERYFRHNILIDFADVGGNVADGAHIAAMGGAWLCAIYGIAGFRDSGGDYSFDPHLGGYVENLKFSLVLCGRTIDIEMNQEETHYHMRSGDDFTIRHRGEDVALKEGKTSTVSNAPA